MRIRLGCILIFLIFFGCGNPPEVLEGPLTQEVLERHLVELDPVRYKSDGGWKWTCERVYFVTQHSSTEAEARVYEKATRIKGGGRYRVGRWQTNSRNVTYHLKRNTVNDNWYIESIEGKPIRKFGILKIRLALRTGEFVKGEKPERISKSMKPTEQLATPQAEDITEESLHMEEQPDSQSSIDELQKAIASLEDRIRDRDPLTFPDAIVVKGGKEIKCEITSETVDSIRIRTEFGTSDVSSDRVVAVTYGTQKEKDDASRAKSEIKEMQKQRTALKARIRDLELIAQSPAVGEETNERKDELVALDKESAPTPAPVRADEPVQEVASQTFASMGQNLIRNGDFSDGLSQWEKIHSSKVEDRWEVAVKGEGRYLSWSREDSADDAGTVGVIQQMETDVSRLEKLMLSVDVRVSNHSLGGPGWWAEQRGGSGEYPVKILIYYTDAEGKPHVWTHGFLPEFSGRTSLRNFSKVPRDTWFYYEANLTDVAQLVDMDFKNRGQQLPLPAKITSIKLLGQGWDFAAAVDNIKLSGM